MLARAPLVKNGRRLGPCFSPAEVTLGVGLFAAPLAALIAAAAPPERWDPIEKGSILWSMRVKTSVTIDERVLRAIDRATSRTKSRSRVIEDAAREFLARRARAAREARDLEILDGAADALNREMEDVLAYQVDV